MTCSVTKRTRVAEQCDVSLLLKYNLFYSSLRNLEECLKWLSTNMFLNSETSSAFISKKQSELVSNEIILHYLLTIQLHIEYFFTSVKSGSCQNQ
ncbi:UNVERIFIED_CONTAM: hypothetical protein NCL1_42595 [Trichonephila clavipes]